MQQPSATLGYCQAREVRYGCHRGYQRLALFISPGQPTPVPGTQEAVHNARPHHSWTVDSTILSHRPCRHNVTGTIYPFYTDKAVGEASYLPIRGEHCSITPTDHNGVRGVGMTLSCRPGPDYYRVLSKTATTSALALQPERKPKQPIGLLENLLIFQ